MTAFATLFAKRPDSAPGAIKPGLDRIRKAYKELRQPGAKIPTVLVGGTNGKGSTAGQLWQLLTLAGHRPGLFTSPHLLHFSERFQVAGKSIQDDRLVREWELLRQELRSSTYDELSFFEVSTLLALRLFVAESCSHMVLEVGLGGRWDSTNVVDPLMSIITSIGRDHEQFLGSDLAGIAREKAGIMRAGRSILWGGSDDPAVNAAISEAARSCGANLKRYGSEVLDPDLPGDARAAYQQTNLALAAGAARELLSDAEWELAAAGWAGPKTQPHCMRARFEEWPRAYRGRDVLVDVCHNPAGVKAFVEAAKAIDSNTVFVTVSSDKDRVKMARELAHKFSCIVFFATSAERCWQPDGDLPDGTKWADDLPEAIAKYGQDERRLVVCGSVLGIGALVADQVLEVSWS